MIKVLFVCLGNICRSPLAEGIFKDKVRKAGLDDKFTIESGGTSGWHIDEQPDPRSREVAERHGIYLDSLGRKAVNEDFKEFDYIVAMDSDNYADLKHLPASSDPDAAQLFLMRDFDDLGKGLDVPDPYYGGKDGFDHVYELLDRSCEQFLDFVIKENNL